MSKLEKLIQQYCPDGVEWKTFSEVFETITDYTAAGSFKNIADNVQYLKVPDYAMLIRTTDLKSNFIKGGFIYVSESAFNYLWRVNMDKECIVMPNVGNCGEIYYVQPKDLPYEHCALAPNAILVRSNTQNNRYLSYCLQVEDFQRQLKKITSPVGQSKFNKTELKKLVIPVPPLPVQEEIVRVLDTFTELQAELQAELQKRLQQYNYYRDNLLTNFTPEQASKEYTLGEVTVDIYSGATPSKEKREYWVNGTIPWMSSGEVNLGQVYEVEGRITQLGYDKCSTKMVPEGSVVIALAGQGKTRGTVAILRTSVCTNQSLAALVPQKEIVSGEYLYYYLKTQYAKLREVSAGDGTRGGLNLKMLKAYKVVIPSHKAQDQIVAILDRFDTLTTDLIQGLPAEIEKRRQQYEFYRDKLLTFKRKEA